jgi:transposase
MASRYELSEGPWHRMQDLLPGRQESVGRTAKDNRVLVNGVLWVLRSGARGSDWPERYGKYKSGPKRFARWAARGVWERLFRTLTQDAKNEHLLIDCTLGRAHQPAAPGREKGIRTRLWGVPAEG